MKRRDLAIGVAALAALGGGAGTAWWRLRASAPDLPADFWALRFDRPEGGELRFASLRGRPLLLNFWATWCPPCIRELPMLDRFQREQSGWQVVALAVDNPPAVREFLRQRPLGIAVGLATATGLELGRALGNDQGALPFTVVFDSLGVPRARKLGALSESELSAWASGLA